MENFFRLIIQLLFFIWSSLKPIITIVLVFVIIGVSLFAYDQYRSYQEKQLGARLIKKLEVEPTCNNIVNAQDKFIYKFKISSRNKENVRLERVGIDVSLIATTGKKFATLLNTTPKSSVVNGDGQQFIERQFEPTITLLKNDNQEISLTLQATNKNEAKANSHTIVIYKGKINFHFSPEMTIETTCQFQVRYP